MKVYHGSIEIVKSPDVLHSYRPLDFGKGFYVTTVKEQAEKWAKRKADLYNKPIGIINEYDQWKLILYDFWEKMILESELFRSPFFWNY